MWLNFQFFMLSLLHKTLLKNIVSRYIIGVIKGSVWYYYCGLAERRWKGSIWIARCCTVFVIHTEKYSNWMDKLILQNFIRFLKMFSSSRLDTCWTSERSRTYFKAIEDQCFKDNNGTSIILILDFAVVASNRQLVLTILYRSSDFVLI